MLISFGQGGFCNPTSRVKVARTLPTPCPTILATLAIVHIPNAHRTYRGKRPAGSATLGRRVISFQASSMNRQLVMTDQPDGCDHSDLSALGERCDHTATRSSSEQLLDRLGAINSDLINHHLVEVVQEPASGHGSDIVCLVAACICGWRSGELQLYLGASTRWAEERARHQLENAGTAHIRSLNPPSS